MSDPLEELHWHLHLYTLRTPEEFEARRGEPWLAEGTRNHGTYERGIQREEFEPDKELEVEDHHLDALRALVVGRTIVAIDREPSSGRDWGQSENTVRITLGDGAVLNFMGFGYDASGLITTYEPPR